MRMWMVDPGIMCRKHLLGEHVEIHMLIGSLRSGKSIQGFLDRGLLEPQNIVSRHRALVREMLGRGYRHKSELNINFNISQIGEVDQEKSLWELLERCSECSTRFFES